MGDWIGRKVQPEEHLVENYSDGPDVCLVVVLVAPQHFWSHVEWRT